MASAVVLMSSCSKDLETRLEGTWNVDRVTFTNSFEPSLNYDITNDGTIEFKSDGTGKSTNKNGETSTFTWSASDDKVTFTPQGESTIVFDVETNKRKEQVWVNKEIATIGSQTFTSELKVRLSKK